MFRKFAGLAAAILLLLLLLQRCIISAGPMIGTNQQSNHNQMTGVRNTTSRVSPNELKAINVQTRGNNYSHSSFCGLSPSSSSVATRTQQHASTDGGGVDLLWEAVTTKRPPHIGAFIPWMAEDLPLSRTHRKWVSSLLNSYEQPVQLIVSTVDFKDKRQQTAAEWLSTHQNIAHLEQLAEDLHSLSGGVPVLVEVINMASCFGKHLLSAALNCSHEAPIVPECDLTKFWKNQVRGTWDAVDGRACGIAMYVIKYGKHGMHTQS